MIIKCIKKLLNSIVEIYAKIKDIEIYNNTGDRITIIEKERKELKEKVEDHKNKVQNLKSWRKEFEEKLSQSDKDISDKELYELLIAQEESEEETKRLEIEIKKLNSSHENQLKEIRNDINTRTALVISVALFILVCGSFILFLSYYGLENFRENIINIRNESEIRMALIGIILIFFSTSFILEVLIKNKSDNFFHSIYTGYNTFLFSV